MKRGASVARRRECILKMSEVSEIPHELVIDYIEDKILADSNFPVRTTTVGINVEQHGSFVVARSNDGALVYLLGGDIIGTERGGDHENMALKKALELRRQGYTFIYGTVPVGEGNASTRFCEVYQKREKFGRKRYGKR